MESSHSKNVSITANCKNSRKLTVFLYTVLFDAYTTPSVWAVFFLPGTGYESLTPPSCPYARVGGKKPLIIARY